VAPEPAQPVFAPAPVEAEPEIDFAERAAIAAHAANLLTELTRESFSAPLSPPEPEPEPARAPAPADDVRPDLPTGPAPMVARDQADNAMLLRELSSLGFGGDEDRSYPAASTPRPVSAPEPQAKKKRKGLFGRG
jgi:hypothetical protein